MTLPNREQATVPPEKLSGYLLSLNHPVGHSKALFFRALGFDDDNVEQLAGALLKIAQSEAVSDTIRTEYGVKYVISGELTSTTDKTARIVTIWIIDKGQTSPRFITAYPSEE